MNEEQSFNLFVKIMSRFQFREMFKTNLDVLHLRLYQLERLIQDYLPEVYDYFNALKISSHMFATEWFLTLYAAKFPLNLSIRVIYMYLNDGFTVVFSLALAILDTSACELLMLDFDGILKLLQMELPKKYRRADDLKKVISHWHIWIDRLKMCKLMKVEDKKRDPVNPIITF